MRVIIHSTSRGTFLDYNGFFGWAFFSGDSGDIVARVKAEQTARTFASEADARAYIEQLGGYSDLDGLEPVPTDLAFIPVDTNADYAPIDACVAAGVSRWEAPEVPLTAPFKFNFHTGEVGHSFVYGQVGSGKSAFHPNLLLVTKLN